eukprot:7310175-Prymnesium_polylepis.1
MGEPRMRWNCSRHHTRASRCSLSASRGQGPVSLAREHGRILRLSPCEKICKRRHVRLHPGRYADCCPSSKLRAASHLRLALQAAVEGQLDRHHVQHTGCTIIARARPSGIRWRYASGCTLCIVKARQGRCDHVVVTKLALYALLLDKARATREVEEPVACHHQVGTTVEWTATRGEQ